MIYVLVRNHGTGQVAHDPMDIDHNAVGALRLKGGRLDGRVNLAPRLCPLGADLFAAADRTTLKRLRPGHVGGHEGEGGVAVARGGSVGGLEQRDLRGLLGWA